MKFKKSQAALEFLVTYGWALLAVLVTVGVLIYFGIFNTSRYVDDKCNFGKQIVCEDYLLQSNGNLSLRLRNNFGVSINITRMTIRSNYNDAGQQYMLSSDDIIQYSSINFTRNIGAPSLSKNEKIQMTVIVEFHRAGGNNPLHNQTGDLLLTVQ